MLKVCEPCLIVMTRWPRRPSSAASRTTSVVLPLCFRPTTVTSGGRRPAASRGEVVGASDIALRPRSDRRRRSFGAREVVGSVHVEEDVRRIAVPPHPLGGQPRNSHVVVERDDASVSGGEPRLDRRAAPLSIVRARRLEAAL